ncbi:MAG: hypothetical protein HW416_2961 [Chloroflexi bacterium]|nr:hypothetical protein [Chloroflexota bacterium]
MAATEAPPTQKKSAAKAWDDWTASTGIPVHEGFYIQDLRTLQLGWWEERQCNAAFLKLAGQEGVSEARVTEIPAGQSLPPLKFALDEVVYVVEGRGITNIWREPGGQQTSFEWQKHSLFRLPRHHYRQLSSTQGGQPARLLHFNYLPITMTSVPDPEFFFNNSFVSTDGDSSELATFYSAATAVQRPDREWGGGSANWVGNFFPDMRAWDKLATQVNRGAGAAAVSITFPGAPMTSHMAVFPPFTYKKAHRHGPGVVIVVPAGEGYSVMWPEGQEKQLIRWQEASVMVPPNKWWHQHFNAGGAPARYLAMHCHPGVDVYSESVENLERDQIEYTAEDPWIRETFAAELVKKGLEPRMPAEAYTNRDYKWTPLKV